MVKGTRVRQKGKVKLSSYFKNFNDGDSVAVITNPSVRAAFPKRLKGLSGKVEGSRGKFKLIKIKDGKTMKMYIIHPIHLRKL